MRLEDLAEQIGVPRQTIRRWIDTKRYGIPAPEIDNGRMVWWRDGRIERWVRRYRKMKETGSDGRDAAHPDRPRVAKVSRVLAREAAERFTGRGSRAPPRVLPRSAQRGEHADETPSPRDGSGSDE